MRITNVSSLFPLVAAAVMVSISAATGVAMFILFADRGTATAEEVVRQANDAARAVIGRIGPNTTFHQRYREMNTEVHTTDIGGVSTREERQVVRNADHVFTFGADGKLADVVVTVTGPDGSVVAQTLARGDERILRYADSGLELSIGRVGGITAADLRQRLLDAQAGMEAELLAQGADMSVEQRGDEIVVIRREVAGSAPALDTRKVLVVDAGTRLPLKWERYRIGTDGSETLWEWREWEAYEVANAAD